MEEATASRWLQRPCFFHLLRSYATKCCACELEFRFFNRGYVCEFCGYFCHSGGTCSRKVWLPRELFRRRICSKCDTYRKVCANLRAGEPTTHSYSKVIFVRVSFTIRYVATGTKFALCGKGGRREVTLRLSERTGELLILSKLKCKNC